MGHASAPHKQGEERRCSPPGTYVSRLLVLQNQDSQGTDRPKVPEKIQGQVPQEAQAVAGDENYRRDQRTKSHDTRLDSLLQTSRRQRKDHGTGKLDTPPLEMHPMAPMEETAYQIQQPYRSWCQPKEGSKSGMGQKWTMVQFGHQRHELCAQKSSPQGNGLAQPSRNVRSLQNQC